VLILSVSAETREAAVCGRRFQRLQHVAGRVRGAIPATRARAALIGCPMSATSSKHFASLQNCCPNTST
jgi:hypothetical protein